jgi:diadenosine tetraphosphate (Ap4A) HIT family hydrolase
VTDRVPVDLDSYVERVRSGPCFVCGIVNGTHDTPQHVVYDDGRHIAFLPNRHVLLGYVLVAPKDHREAVVGNFTAEEYLDLQRLVHRVGRALAATVPTERIYILSLGSQQGNKHVHWHVAALPPGVPYEEQQYAALMFETKGVLDLSDEDQAHLAQQLRATLERTT